MVRRNTSGFVAFAAAAIGLVVVSGLIGYYILGGPGPNAAAGGGSETASLPPAVTAPASAAPPVTPSRSNANYVAPGSPRIRIKEEKSAILPNKSQQVSKPRHSAEMGDIPTPDQEALRLKPVASASDTPAVSHSTSSGHSHSSDTSASDSSDPVTPDDPAPNTDSPAVIPPPPGMSDSSEAAPPHKAATRPKSPDQPKPSGHAPASPASGSSTPAPADSSGTNGEAGQDAPSESRLYRVQTGSFADPNNARQLADTLRSKGYTPSARVSHEGGKTIYKVQVGAFRSRDAADKAVKDLQKDNVPSYISNGTP